METVVFDQTPLAEYLKDEGEEQPRDWGFIEAAENVHTPPPSPPASTTSFAPVGRPLVKKRFRNNLPKPIRVDVPRAVSLSSSINNRYFDAVASRIDRADNARFLEQFRYTIIASQLLSGNSALGQHHRPAFQKHQTQDGDGQDTHIPTSTGLIATAVGAFAVAWMISWIYTGGLAHLAKKRVYVFVVVLAVCGVLGHAYVRQQWLRYVRDQTMREITRFVGRSQDFDSVTSAAVGLVQEVELVSRGYRLSTPLPPISRIEDRSQNRRCVRLRKALKLSFSESLQKYKQTSEVIKGFAEQLDLEKYYDIYDISELDMADAQQGFSEEEFDDAESLRTLKIMAARFHTIRKMLLCALLGFDAKGDNTDFLRWTTAVEGLRTLNEVTQNGYERIHTILGEEDSFPVPQPPKSPLSPGRERWRSSLRKLNSLSSGIRGLQAKLTLLREESDRSLNEADDVSELGPNLLAQYDSFGQDLKTLTQAWEDGRNALAMGIDRNEKRLSSISSILSPTISLSGLTTVDEGGAAEAFKALTGDSPPGTSMSSPKEPDSEEIFEAVALPPRPKSMLTRDERIAKMKEDRERKAEARERNDANRGMLRELEMVINLRPKGRSNTTPGGRASL